MKDTVSRHVVHRLALSSEVVLLRKEGGRPPSQNYTKLYDYLRVHTQNVKTPMTEVSLSV